MVAEGRLDGAARWIQCMVLDVKKGKCISRVGLKVRIGIEQFRHRRAKVSAVLVGMIGVKGALKGGS